MADRRVVRLPQADGQCLDLADPGIQEVHVRIGEVAVSNSASDLLVAVGLGSCIGLAVVSRPSGIAALCHVFLPEPPDDMDSVPQTHVGRYATTAVPAIVERMSALGVTRASRMKAVVVGAAQMFDLRGRTSSGDVGARNLAAVTQALQVAGIEVVASDTGGSTGRTVRVSVETGRVLVKPAGKPEACVYEGPDAGMLAA